MTAGMLVWLVLIVACVLMLIRLHVLGKQLLGDLAQAELLMADLERERERAMKAVDAVAVYRAQLIAATTAEHIIEATNILIGELRQARQ